MAENEKLEQTQKAAPAQAEKAKKEKKSEKRSKPGVFARIGKWLKEMKSELKKVQWPTRKQTINNTLIVIACVLVVGVCIWVFDLVANEAIKAIISLLG